VLRGLSLGCDNVLHSCYISCATDDVCQAATAAADGGSNWQDSIGDWRPSTGRACLAVCRCRWNSGFQPAGEVGICNTAFQCIHISVFYSVVGCEGCAAEISLGGTKFFGLARGDVSYRLESSFSVIQQLSMSKLITTLFLIGERQSTASRNGPDGQ
jgi:hypothetical protein